MHDQVKNTMIKDCDSVIDNDDDDDVTSVKEDESRYNLPAPSSFFFIPHTSGGKAR